jgi:molecular chaperone DnaK (HSP70)
VKLGIDFGTTRIVAAAVDRGNYPVVKFDTRDGTADWFPSLVALRGAERRNHRFHRALGAVMEQ